MALSFKSEEEGMGDAAVPGDKECFFKKCSRSKHIAIYLSNPYILNMKTNIKAVIPSQVCGNFARCNVTRRLR